MGSGSAEEMTVVRDRFGMEGVGERDPRGSREDGGEGRDGGEVADREPKEERWRREMETGVGEMEGDGRREMEMMMGCCVREMEMGGLGFAA